MSVAARFWNFNNRTAGRRINYRRTARRMSIQSTQKRIVLFVLLPALAFYFGLRLFAQYRHVDVYVSRQAPMPAELAAGLHVEEHKIDRTVTIESPYDSATDKILTTAEIRRLRSAIAWSKASYPRVMVLPDSAAFEIAEQFLQTRAFDSALRWVDDCPAE